MCLSTHWLLCSPCVYNYTVQTRTSKETIEKLIQSRQSPPKMREEWGNFVHRTKNHKGEMELNERLIIIKRPPAHCKVMGDPPIAGQRFDRRAALLVGNLSGWRGCSGYCREQNGIKQRTSPRVSKQPDKGRGHMQEREAGDQTWRISDAAQQLQLEVKKHRRIRPLVGAKN